MTTTTENTVHDTEEIMSDRQKWEASLLEQCDALIHERITGYVRRCLANGTGRWMCDPENPDVVGFFTNDCPANWGSDSSAFVLYTDEDDLECSEWFDRFLP